MFDLGWPPPGLGLGKIDARNLADGRRLRIALVAAVGFTLIALGTDAALFAGASAAKLRSLTGMSLMPRIGMVVLSTLVEELLYRFVVMTMVVWAIVRIDGDQAGKGWVMWTGIGVSATLFAAAYAGNLPDVAHPLLRALAFNGPAGLVLGWLYWKQGIETAVAAHLFANLFLYFVVPMV
jgi:membrane protease YdiL (CAAX protease family)